MTRDLFFKWDTKGESPVVLVTGGSRGIGRAIVLAFAEAGANVAFTYGSNDFSAKEVVDEAEKFCGKIYPVKADVKDFARAQEAVDEVTKVLGAPSILVSNAGIARDGVVWKMEEKAWDEVIDLNLKGCFNYIRAIAPFLKERRVGKIINITSINGIRGKFGQSNYAASKAGIIGFTKSVARELGPYNINVNAVAPGMIQTDMMEKIPEEIRENARKEAVLGRLGMPEEVASVVLFLCTYAARHITGEVIKVDGGQYI